MCLEIENVQKLQVLKLDSDLFVEMLFSSCGCSRSNLNATAIRPQCEQSAHLKRRHTQHAVDATRVGVRVVQSEPT